MSGWYAMKRGWIEHDLFRPEGRWSKAEAWIWMIENAAFTPTTVSIGGAPFTVERGCLCYSLRFLSGKWRWSVKAVRTFLATLEKHGTIVLSVEKGGTETGTARTHIRLCNYEKYQATGHATGTRRAQQGHKEEQGNNLKKVEANASTLRGGAALDGFQAFWDAYPHRAGAKRGRKAAEAKYAAALRSGVTAQTILDGARRAHRDPTVQRGYARDPAAWLHQAGWQDDIPDNVAVIKAEPAYGEIRTRPNGERVRYVGGHQQWERVYA